jgi:hypothetical protein
VYSHGQLISQTHPGRGRGGKGKGGEKEINKKRKGEKNTIIGSTKRALPGVHR